MPHSTSDALVNGDSSPSSKTLSHITSYPVVASGIDTFKANPYGKKSIDVANGTYARFAKPVEGYLETPYQYAKPYINKADELGEKALETVDGHFPIVKEKPETIYETTKDQAKETVDGHFPIVKEKPETIYETIKNWVLWPVTYAKDAWTDELTKTKKARPNQVPFLVLIAALISFAFRVISDFLTFVADYTRPRYEATRDTTQEYINNAGHKAEEAKKYAEDRYHEALKYGEDKYAEARKRGQELEGQAKEAGEEAKAQAKETGEQAKDQAKETKEQTKEQANKAKK